MKKTPAYMIVYNSIKQKISDGDYSVGSLLPTEPMLEEQYNVSRTTIRKAVELLAQESLVIAKQGKGTEVLNYRTTQRLNYITSFSQTLEEKGYTIETRGLHIDELVPPKNILHALELQDNDSVYRIQRIQCYNGNPICLMTNYILKSIAPDIINNTESFTSLYKLLEKKYNIKFDTAVENISARNSTYIEAQLLGMPVGDALLISKRISYMADKPVEYAHLKIIGDKYEFRTFLVGQH